MMSFDISPVAAAAIDLNPEGSGISRAQRKFNGHDVKIDMPDGTRLKLSEISHDSEYVSTVQDRRCYQSQHKTDRKNFSKLIGLAFTSSDVTLAIKLFDAYGENTRFLSARFSSGDKTYPEVSPFWLACRTGNSGLVQILYSDRSQLNEAVECINGTNGRTPLMIAVMKGHINVVRQLLNWGADTEAKDSEGHGVDYLNLYFNSRLTQLLIADLLAEHRTEKNLPQYNPHNDPDVFIPPSCRTQ